MQISSYINNDILPLTSSDSVEKVMNFFKKTTYTHVPLAENSKLLGCIAEDDVQGFAKNAHVRDYMNMVRLFFVRDTTNWISVLETFAKNETNIMPVLTDAGKYLGYYDLVDIMSFFRATPFLKESGGIVVVEKGLTDYSFSEVSQIVEGNNGKLLGGFISAMREDRVEITLKIAGASLNDIMQTFRRYSYNVIFGNERDAYQEILKERSAYLEKYLNI